MRPKNRIFCPQAHRLKLFFETEKKAQLFMKYNADEIREETGFAPIRAYYCDKCCGWHVTSRQEFTAPTPHLIFHTEMFRPNEGVHKYRISPIARKNLHIRGRLPRGSKSPLVSDPAV